MIIKALNKVDKYTARRICLVCIPAAFWIAAAAAVILCLI
nr:hypothetical protein K21LAMBDA1_LOCUS70 [Klebsiella phage vB_Kpn_K21lambda1]